MHTAANYRFEALKGYFKLDQARVRREIMFFFLIIVFEGELYEASFGETLDLKKAGHLVYETRYLSNLTQSLVPMYIDVVRKDAFEETILTIEREVSGINEWLGRPHKIQRIFSEMVARTLESSEDAE